MDDLSLIKLEDGLIKVHIRWSEHTWPSSGKKKVTCNTWEEGIGGMECGSQWCCGGVSFSLLTKTLSNEHRYFLLATNF